MIKLNKLCSSRKTKEMYKRERKPNALLNNGLYKGKKIFNRTERMESAPQDSLHFQSPIKLDLAKKFETTFDSDKGGENNFESYSEFISGLDFYAFKDK